MTKEKWALLSYPFASIFPIRGDMDYKKEEINDVNENVENKDDEDASCAEDTGQSEEKGNFFLFNSSNRLNYANNCSNK